MNTDEIPVTRLHECSDGKHRNDEQYKEWQVSSEALELKKAQFNKDPDQFVHVDDIVIGALRSPHGIGIYFGKVNRIDFDVAFSRLILRSLELQIQMNMQAALKSKMTGLTDTDGNPLT